jgi:hypothetical protein
VTVIAIFMSAWRINKAVLSNLEKDVQRGFTLFTADGASTIDPYKTSSCIYAA